MSHLVIEMRIVMDTSVLVAGLRSRNGASNAVLRLIADGRLIALASPPVFLEYEEVLKRAEHRLIHGLSLRDIDQFLAALAAAIEPVEIHFGWRPQIRDADDDMILEAAINGRAEALVTHNVADFAEASIGFGVPVLRPAELLERIKL
jgi:putative PIN family toxin of toxin-antitoxin system